MHANAPADAPPTLDASRLRRLRRVLAAGAQANGRGMLLREVVALAQVFPPEIGLTVDFAAARELGRPLVIVRERRQPPRGHGLAALTPREAEVARLVAFGLRNKEIAERLVISVATVKDHIHRILAKNGLRGRAAIVAAFSGTADHEQRHGAVDG